MVLQAADIRLRPQLWAACSEEVAVFCKGVEPGGWGLGVGEGGRIVWASSWHICPRPCCCAFIYQGTGHALFRCCCS